MWAEFEQHRKEINKPLTDLARSKAANLLSNYSRDEQQVVVDYSINGKWPGLYPDCLSKNTFQKKQTQPTKRIDYGEYEPSPLADGLKTIEGERVFP